MGILLSLFRRDVYNLPAEFCRTDIEKFKRKRIVFIINNLGQSIHKGLFLKYKNVNDRYYWIRIIDDEMTHNIVNLDDFYGTRYAFIKVELVDENHVNCIIIDNEKKAIIYFEPKGEEEVDIDKMKDLIALNYTWYLSKDLGFNPFNKIQYFDRLCQTYILMSFLSIVNNPETPITKYSDMLNDLINDDSIKSFHYDIFKHIEDHEIDINQSKVKLIDSMVNLKEEIHDDFTIVT